MIRFMAIMFLSLLVGCSSTSESTLTSQNVQLNTAEQTIPGTASRRIEMDLGVEDKKEGVSQVRELVARHEGYVFFLDEMDGFFTDMDVRIPSSNVDVFMADIAYVGKVSSLVEEVSDLNVDVSDVEARMSALMVTRDRLEELLKQAESVDEILDISSQLSDVQNDIDDLSKKKNKHRQEISMTDIKIDIDVQRQMGPVTWLVVMPFKLLIKLFVI